MEFMQFFFAYETWSAYGAYNTLYKKKLWGGGNEPIWEST